MTPHQRIWLANPGLHMGCDGLPWDLSVNGTLAAPAGSALHPSVTSFRLKKALTKSSHSGASYRIAKTEGMGPRLRGDDVVMQRAHTWLKKA